jgi:hypothetical protein
MRHIAVPKAGQSEQGDVGLGSAAEGEALTGAVFATDEQAVAEADAALR